jgi:hypothetical protein
MQYYGLLGLRALLYSLFLSQALTYSKQLFPDSAAHTLRRRPMYFSNQLLFCAAPVIAFFCASMCVFIHCSLKHQRSILDRMKAFGRANLNTLRSLMIDWHSSSTQFNVWFQYYDEQETNCAIQVFEITMVTAASGIGVYSVFHAP